MRTAALKGYPLLVEPLGGLVRLSGNFEFPAAAVE